MKKKSQPIPCLVVLKEQNSLFPKLTSGRVLAMSRWLMILATVILLQNAQFSRQNHEKTSQMKQHFGDVKSRAGCCKRGGGDGKQKLG